MSIHFIGRLGGPDDLVEHPQLEPEVKRAILASWASDACAVRSQPRLRKPAELDTPIEVSDILAAMRRLDGDNVLVAKPEPSRPVRKSARRSGTSAH